MSEIGIFLVLFYTVMSSWFTNSIVSRLVKKSCVKNRVGKTSSSCLAAGQSEISKLLREREQAIVSLLHLSGKEVNVWEVLPWLASGEEITANNTPNPHLSPVPESGEFFFVSDSFFASTAFSYPCLTSICLSASLCFALLLDFSPT